MAKSVISEKTLQAAFLAAKKARMGVHAPYSKFLVGAALILSDDEIIPGCNIENASYGATICAERTAIFTAVGQGKKSFKGIVLVTEPLAVPCGLCLQVMSEFFAKDTPIYLSDSKKLGKPLLFSELLPHTFDASALANLR